MQLRILFVLLFFILLSCSHTLSSSSTENIETLKVLQSKHLGFIDSRSRFREIFCTILDKRGMALPDYMSCNDALIRVGQEEKHTSMAVDLDVSNAPFIIGLVPGIAWQCVRNWLNNDNSGPKHLMTQGFDVQLFEVDGLSSASNNAQQIHNFVNQLNSKQSNKPIILIGYSKGAVDVLYAVSNYPQLQEKVVAVVSISGAIGGSPLANNTDQSSLNLLTYIPMSACDSGDEKAIETLHTHTRKAWLSNNPLPKNIHYYSVITYPEKKRISFGLKTPYGRLSKIDSRNDGQLIFYDQLIPNSQLLAFVNADHWAMSVPVARQSYLNRISFANKNKYPREVLLEAIIRYVEEDLKEEKKPIISL